MIYAKLMEILKDILLGVDFDGGAVMITKDNGIELINHFNFHTDGSLLVLKDIENDNETLIDLENANFELGYNKVHFNDGLMDCEIELV